MDGDSATVGAVECECGITRLSGCFVIEDEDAELAVLGDEIFLWSVFSEQFGYVLHVSFWVWDRHRRCGDLGPKLSKTKKRVPWRWRLSRGATVSRGYAG